MTLLLTHAPGPGRHFALALCFGYAIVMLLLIILLELLDSTGVLNATV